VIVHNGENTWELVDEAAAESFIYTLATLEAGEDPKAVPEDASPLLLFNTVYDSTQVFLHRDKPDRSSSSGRWAARLVEEYKRCHFGFRQVGIGQTCFSSSRRKGRSTWVPLRPIFSWWKSWVSALMGIP
jgi:hypothetical protein